MIGNYSEDDVNRIGGIFAGVWGGELIDAYFDNEKKEYVFNCIENGERFSFTLSEKEMEKEIKCLNN